MVTLRNCELQVLSLDTFEQLIEEFEHFSEQIHDVAEARLGTGRQVSGTRHKGLRGRPKKKTAAFKQVVGLSRALSRMRPKAAKETDRGSDFTWSTEAADKQANHCTTGASVFEEANLYAATQRFNSVRTCASHGKSSVSSKDTGLGSMNEAEDSGLSRAQSFKKKLGFKDAAVIRDRSLEMDLKTGWDTAGLPTAARVSPYPGSATDSGSGGSGGHGSVGHGSGTGSGSGRPGSAGDGSGGNASVLGRACEGAVAAPAPLQYVDAGPGGLPFPPILPA